ncbi:HAMP domain-containing sensor histidine kinase [Saccharibacillus alkalitolerans]|uniref:histidine kinase n=1 Tax=Saccharibacillus alkalitolerans TaxID=2705290 RepID=A0ABX0F2X9_9BACL|nr:ATP-binding protein [Saccharibacillus alkalitolerans]NGZ74220.1 cell wall metabolism sensor histidine kinase WalK [Saccharibacillus alkalitolerans]
MTGWAERVGTLWRTLVGKLWLTIIGLVACVLLTLGFFLLPYVDITFANSAAVKRMLIYVGVIGFSMTTVFALFLLKKITQPMRQLIDAADSVRRGDYATRVHVEAHDEIGELASTFNLMAARLEENIRDLNIEKEQLAGVLRSMSDAMITFGRDGTVQLTNPGGERLLKDWAAISWDSEEPSPAEASSATIPEPLYPLFRQVTSTLEDRSANVLVRQSVWAVNMAPLLQDNEVRGAVAVLRDVTEAVNLEKMRKDFVANVSHEIRTPLSMMQGYSEALLDGFADSPAERDELLHVIHDESLRMGRLVKDLLDLARMEAGHTDISRNRVEIGELVERVYRKFAVRAKEGELDFSLERAEGELVLEQADEDRLEQVVTNLLDNAFRHTPPGRKVTIAVKPTIEDGEALTIYVADEGHGIPAEDVPYIFERFYKADKARTRAASSGTGLGLAIVKNIIDAHGGRIQVESVVGEGTKFRVILLKNGKNAG